MPITFEIDHTRKTVFAKAIGFLKKKDLFDFQKVLQSDPEIKYFHECFDLSHATDIEQASDKDFTGLAELSSRLDDRAQPTRLAIIASSDLHFGLARMYESYRSMQPKSVREISVFRSREDALRWLSGAGPSS